VKYWSIIFVFVGLGALVGTYFTYRDTRTFIETASRADGEVVELLEEDSDDSTVYRPVIRFQSTSSDRSFEFAGEIASSPPSYDVGEHVTVLYDPATPAEAQIEGFFNQWLLVLILGILGVVCSLMGLAGGLYLLGGGEEP